MKGVVIRAIRPSDEGFIIKGWAETYRDAAAVKGADRVWYWDHMVALVTHYCREQETRIACSLEDQDQLLGFACFSTMGQQLHYVYVKQAFRKLGIARDLLEGVPITSYSFLSAQARPPKDWRFTPRLLG